ncbi:MAG TPA: hypothetical protein VE344_04140 [Methylomirabilota bacterium]|nr:hypothetical protein [Methylomirabilota bacterium]
MNSPLKRCSVAFLFALFFSTVARAQLTLPNSVSARSVSGQFAVVAARQISPLTNQRAVLTNTDFVRLDPALLAVSAERIKTSLWQQLDIDSATPWRGQIFLALHPAQSLDENVTIISSRFNGAWNYRVELPDILARTRLARAVTGVVLLEFANRNADDHSAEIPAWLVEGLSQQLLASKSSEFILSSPAAAQNGVLQNRIVATQRGWDLLLEAHRALQNQPALTFDQLSWPTDAQLAGNDDGVYRASAQLFINELLALKNGGKELRTMLQTLPHFYNWQIAFHDAFRSDFPKPIDLEKWWSLQTINFAALDIGPMWTPAASRDKLDEILRVPVEYRSESNNLPVRAEISVQTVIRNFDSERRDSVLQTKLRDLQLAELRMSPQFAQLTEQYRSVIADYLGEHQSSPRKVILGKHPIAAQSKPTAQETLNKLDALDAQRREVEAKI